MTKPPGSPVSTRPEYEPPAPVIKLAPDPPPPDPFAEAASKRRLRVALASGIVLALVASFAAWTVRSAEGHYDRGREALVAERYSTAIQEFNAARLIVVPYRDAETLAAVAASALNERMRQEAVRETRLEDAVRDFVQLADLNLGRGDGDGAERALSDARDLVPKGTLSSDPFTLVLLHALSRRLDGMCRRALADGRWDSAHTYAVALRAIDPRDASGARLADRAQLGARLQDRLDDARAAARRGKWRRVLRLARAVLDDWPGFPGAAPLATEARQALARRPAGQSPTVSPETPTSQTTPAAPTAPTPPPP